MGEVDIAVGDDEEQQEDGRMRAQLQLERNRTLCSSGSEQKKRNTRRRRRRCICHADVHIARYACSMLNYMRIRIVRWVRRRGCSLAVGLRTYLAGG